MWTIAQCCEQGQTSSVGHQDPELDCWWPLGRDYVLRRVTLQSLVQRRACEMLKSWRTERSCNIQRCGPQCGICDVLGLHQHLWNRATCHSGLQYGSVQIYQHPRRKISCPLSKISVVTCIFRSYSCMTILPVTKHALLSVGFMSKISKRCSGHRNPPTPIPQIMCGQTYPKTSWGSVQRLGLV